MEDLYKYLPLYLGQKVYENYNNRVVTLTGVNTKEEYPVKVIHDKTGIVWGFKYHEIKLILRPLSSMTEEEGKALDCMGWETRWDKNGVPHSLFQPEAFIKLIEWGFDIFGLKEKGLCIYENELNPEDIKE